MSSITQFHNAAKWVVSGEPEAGWKLARTMDKARQEDARRSQGLALQTALATDAEQNRYIPPDVDHYPIAAKAIYTVAQGILSLGGFGCRSGDKLGDVPVQTGETDENGQWVFTDQHSNEKVMINVDDQSGKKVTHAPIAYMGNRLFAAYLVNHPDYAPSLEIFPHNSSHDVTLTPAPLNFKVYKGPDQDGSIKAAREFAKHLRENSQPKGCVPAEDIALDAKRRIVALGEISGKLPKGEIGEYVANFGVKAIDKIISLKRIFSEMGVLENNCVAYQTWGTDAVADWNIGPSLSLRVYGCMTSIPPEKCSDGVDNDCDGEIDEVCSDCFEKKLGTVHFANAIRQTTDGGYVAAVRRSYNENGAFYSDVGIIKLNSAGDVEWEKKLAERRAAIFQPSAILQTKDGGIILTCGPDAQVFKLNSVGQHEWNKTFSPAQGTSYITSIQETNDGGYVMSGSQYWQERGKEESAMAGSKLKVRPWETKSDAWVLKLGSTGNLEWQKNFEGDNHNSEASSIQQTTDGGYIVAGSKIYSYVNQEFAWVMRLSQDGNVRWIKSTDSEWNSKLSELNKSGPGSFSTIQQTSDGGFIAVGRTGGEYHSACVLKLDATEKVEWYQTFHWGKRDHVLSIQQVESGGYVIAGNSRHKNSDVNAWILKLDSSGNKEWKKVFGKDSMTLSSMQKTNDGGYILSGGEWFRPAGPSSRDDRAWVIKLNANGDVGCEKK